MRPDASFGTHDLAADWSDTLNPNGPWSAVEGTTVIAPPVSAWAGITGQTAFAHASTGNGHTPALMKVASAALGDELEVGDIAIHAQDDGSGAGYGQARVIWTSPETGSIDVSGAIWLGRTTLGRADTWSLSVAGVQMASGTISAGDGRGRSNPIEFSEGSASPLTALPVSEGDQVVLELAKAATSAAGELAGVRLTVTLAR